MAREALSRRAILKNGTLFLAGSLIGGWPRRSLFGAAPALRVGLVTDLHYADKNPSGTRHYRESLDKLREAVERFNAEKVDVVVELGDFIDRAPSVKKEIGFLEAIEREFSKLRCPRHYVLGNHCVATLTKREFFQHSGAEKPHYSFDAGGYHFIVLDACYRSDMRPYGRNNARWNDSNIPPAQTRWLKRDLRKAKERTIVFIHQRLDVGTAWAVKNAPLVRKIFEQSGKVLAVFQGHNHINEYKEVGGIHYVTLAALVDGTGKENNAYSVMDVMPGGEIRITGFRKHESYKALSSAQ